MKKPKKKRGSHHSKGYSKIRLLESVLFFLFVLLLPTQFGKHFFLPFSFLSGVRVDYLAPTIFVTDIIVAALALFHIKEIVNVFRHKLWIVLIVPVILNIIFSLSPAVSLYRTFKLLEIIVAAIVAYSFVGKTNYLYALCASGALQLTIAIMQFINKHSLQGLWYFLGERSMSMGTPGIALTSINGIQFLRPYGTFSHPNSLAGFFLVVYMYALTYKPSGSFVILKYATLFISTCLVFISFSKVAILTLVLLSVLYYLTSSKPCRICVLSRVITLLVMGFVFLQVKSDPLTIQKRIDLMANALSIIASRPLLGVGLGNYVIAQNQFPSPYLFFFNQPVHNIFLLFVAESGILMAAALFLFLFVALRRNRFRALSLVVITIGITGLFDHYWLTLQQNMLLFGLMIGIGLRKHHMV